MSEIRIAELDFFEIKENLKTFLKSQKQFADYNFEGSAMSTLLDVLAYNTTYNGFYLNMTASEMFLDSAHLRENVVSRAKHLGFTSRSVHSLRLRADVQFELFFQESDAASIPQSILIRTKDQIYTVIDGLKHTFTPTTSIYVDNPTVERVVTSAGLRRIRVRFVAKDVEFIEGQRLTHRWTVDKNLPYKQKFIIPNSNVDLESLVVSVQQSAQNTNNEVFVPFKDINTLKPTDAVYYVQEVSGGQYEVVFGDNVLGKDVSDGNIVVVDYVVATGDGAQNASNFRVSGTLGGIKADSVIIKTTEPAGGYRDQETIDEIKFFAPRVYDTQNRAVTKNDYETLLKREIPTVEYLRVWGGEENVPPVYGKVFCAIKPIGGRTVSEDEKARILNTYIKPRSVISMQVELVEPDYLGLIISSQINYFSNKTTKQKDEIKNTVYDKIRAHREQNLQGFDADFRYSRLVKDIDSVGQAIESNLTTVKMKYRITPAFDVPSSYSVLLNNPIDLGDATNQNAAINSTGFYYNGLLSYLGDDGRGKLYVYYLSNDQKIIIQPNAGSVNYATGEIQITNLLVTGIPNDFNYMDLIITPQKNDIVAYRNQILLLDDSDITVDVVDLLKVRLS
jgi:hypothetical protein